MSNLQDDGWDLADLKYIAFSQSEGETYLLEKGDILFNRTNSKELVGKCEVFREDGHWVFASYLVRVRVSPTDADPQFIADFLNTRAGRIQIDRVSRQIIGMTNINAQEIRDLVVPLPPLDVQCVLVSEMDAARASRKAKLAEAGALLSGLDAFLLDQLGLTPPKPDGRLLYAVRLADVRRERFDPHYYHPQFRDLERLLLEVPNKPLGDIIAASNEQRIPNDLAHEIFRYIEIGGVDCRTGEVSVSIVPSKEAPSRARMVVREDDLIVSLTRPHHGSIALIDNRLDGCIASTGFSILRDSKDSSIKRPYLLAILRSQLCLPQMLQRSSGGNYPAVTEPELMQVLIPTPDSDTQDRIVEEQSRRHQEARRLRDEARRLRDEAKARFEAQLLGGEPV